MRSTHSGQGLRTRVLPGALLLSILCAGSAFAQPGPDAPPPPSSEGEGRLFGMEFEFAGRGNRIVNFDAMPFENYERLMREVVAYYGGDPATIKRVDFMKPSSNLEKYPTGERPLFRAEWVDTKGRKWLIEPEYVASTGLDGYELVTPPLADPKEVEGVLERVRGSGIVREGLKSGVHLTLDARDMIKSNGDARALANLIVMHENMEPMLRRVFNPVRGGGHANRFARSIAVDHEDILKEIDALRPEERTRARLESIFSARAAREGALHGVDPMNPDSFSKNWKYRSMNLAKALNINELHNGNSGVVEFRMFDLHALSDPSTHRLEAEMYRAMVEKAKAMAEAGETVRYTPRAAMPEGADPSNYNTPQDPNEAKAAAREMIERLGLDPERFEPLLERNVARHRAVPTEGEFKGMLDALPGGRVEHNGKAFTYGFELEGSGEGFARLARPKDAETNARWDTMSDAEKLQYYREKVGTNRSAVPQHFDLDLERYPFLDPNWKVEGTGNWEIRSLPMESIEETANRMREVKKLTGTSAKGFHLHMRDNGVDWAMLEAKGPQFADFIERSSNWVWLERARKLGTMTSMKSWSNARMKTSDVEAVANMKSSNRATIRNTVPYNREYIDLEIRGFTKDVDNIERLAKMYTEALKTGNFGPWAHTANPLPMSGQGDAPASLRFVDHLEDYLRVVEGVEMTPEMRKVVDGLQHEYGTKATGNARTYSTNVATPLLPWDMDASLDETTRRDLRFQREEFLRSVRASANKVMSGEYGLDLSVANEAGLMRHLGLSEAEARALVAYRANGGVLKTPADVARALGRGEAGASLARLNAADLAKGELGSEELRARLGLSEAVAKELTTYREAMDVVDAMNRAGVAEADLLRMIDRSNGLDLMNAEATAERLSELTGLSKAEAARVIDFRNAHEITSEADLKRAGLTAAEASRVMGLGLDLATANQAALEAAGISAKDALRIVNFREAHNLGKNPSNSWERYDANKAARALVEAGVLSEAKAEAIKLHTGAAPLEGANAETLRERFGLDAETATKVIALRDAHSLDLEGLRAAGLSEAEAKAVLERATSLDPRRASLADLSERTGLTGEELAKVLRADGLDLTSASEADLRARLGLSAAQARKLIEARANGNPLNSVEKLVEAGLSATVAGKAYGLAKGVDFGSATLEELRALGLNEAEAKRLVDARLKAEGAPGLDYNEISRQVRYKTKKWAQENKLSESLLRSLLPRPNPAEVTVTSTLTGEGTGFSRVRAGTGPFVASKISYETISQLFQAVKDGAARRLADRLSEARTAGDAAAMSEIERGINGLRDMKLEIVESNSILADVKDGKVRLSTGLFNQVYARGTGLPTAERAAFRARILGLIMGHEAAHVSGIKAERVADAESVRILERSALSVGGRVTPVEVKAALDVFERPLGYSRLDNFFNRLRNLLRYGTLDGRKTELERAARGEADPLAKYRRGDGTLKWSELTRDKALREGTGVAHFALALFLKEVATVAATGDKARIEEFFDGLLTTDFYKHYGMFVAGARIGEVAYVRYLQGYVKPGFVNGLLKTNLTLAAGMALPMILEGNFDGKVFAISLASLGISSAAVQGGVRSIKWVMTLGKARETGVLARVGLQSTRLAKFGGWFYTAAELAVVLYFAEKMDLAVNGYLDRAAAREALGKAGLAFVDASNAKDATPESLRVAAEKYHEAWIEYRDFLYGPLHMDEAALAERLEGLARRAKIEDDKRQAAIDRVANHPALKARMIARYGSLEAYADSMLAEASKEIGDQVNTYVDSYNLNREKHLNEVYFDNRRGDAFLSDVDARDWILSGGVAGAAGDPWSGRDDRWANWGRSRARESLAESLGGASTNRLQGYEDEAKMYESMAALLRRQGRGDLALELDRRRSIAETLRSADEGLIKGEGGLIDTSKRAGIADALKESIREPALGIEDRIREAGRD